MTEVIVKNGIRYEIGTYANPPPGDYVAYINAYDARDYQEGEHRPFGKSGMISMVNYETAERAREVFEGLLK